MKNHISCQTLPILRGLIPQAYLVHLGIKWRPIFLVFRGKLCDLGVWECGADKFKSEREKPMILMLDSF